MASWWTENVLAVILPKYLSFLRYATLHLENTWKTQNIGQITNLCWILWTKVINGLKQVNRRYLSLSAINSIRLDLKISLCPSNKCKGLPKFPTPSTCIKMLSLYLHSLNTDMTPAKTQWPYLTTWFVVDNSIMRQEGKLDSTSLKVPFKRPNDYLY